jgi:hypothetical protein
MAITSTQSKVPASVCNMAIGRYLDTGTVSATPAQITCGFQPRYVKVVNLTSSTGLVMVEWFEGMTAGTALKTDINGTQSIISTLGITVSAKGFLIGLDTDVLVSGEQLSWMAIG